MNGIIRVPHPIPYQGSKRGIARSIIACFPESVERLIEPFAGSAAVSLSAALHGKAKRFALNDINPALMRLWDEILNRPEAIADAYETLWKAQKGREREFYDFVRLEFNRAQRPDHFLYLLARCVKASVRYNSLGQFNQSPDNRRKGAFPATMRQHVLGASRLLKTKTDLTCADYEQVVRIANPLDLVYMDPPYQGVCKNRDPRYLGQFSDQRFARVLERLNANGISFIVSYDGRTGTKTYGRPLPGSLDLMHIEIDAGRSTQATLLGRDARTFESLYLSPALVRRLKRLPARQIRRAPEPISLFSAVS